MSRALTSLKDMLEKVTAPSLRGLAIQVCLVLPQF